MTFSKQPTQSSSGGLLVTELMGCETELLIWKPNENICFNVPKRWSQLKAIMLSIPIAVVVGVVSELLLGQIMEHSWLFAVASVLLLSSCTYWLFRQPTMKVTIDWKSRSLIIRKSVLSSMNFTNKGYPFESIKSIYIAPYKECSYDGSPGSENYLATLGIDFAEGNSIDIIPMSLSEPTPAGACKTLGRIARLFSQAFEAPIEILEVWQRDQQETEAADAPPRGRGKSPEEECQQRITFYCQQIEEYPSSVDPYLGLGKLYLTEFDYENAIKFFSAALEIEPENLEAYRNRAQAYYDQADSLDPTPNVNFEGPSLSKLLDAAISDLSKPISNYQELECPIAIDIHCEDLTARGTCFSELGQHQKAIDDFSRCLEIQEKNPAAGDMQNLNLSSTLENRAQAYFDAGNGELAAADINRAIKIHPGSPGYLYALRSKIRRFDGDFAGADEDLELSNQ